MDGKFKKIDKDFVLSDSSKNVYGFKLLTSGYQADEFKKLPVGFFNHKNKEDGALVRWEDIRLDGDKIIAKPTINLSHPRGQRTVDEIETGFIAAASLAGLVILETKSELDGETGKEIPVVTKWYNKEADLVTLPGNRNALAVPQLFDAYNNEIQLSDLLQPKTITQMIPKIILQKLQLSDSADDAAVLAAITELSDKAAKADKAEADLADFKKQAAKKELSDVLDAAQAEGKITADLKKDLADDYAENIDGLKKILAKMPKPASVVDQLRQKGDEHSGLYKELSDMSFDDMGEKDMLATCKDQFPELYAQKYERRFGKKPA